jgi:hypothetical protein
MEKAFEIVTDLLAQVSPLGYVVQGILWVIIILAGGVLGTLATIWARSFFA